MPLQHSLFIADFDDSSEVIKKLLELDPTMTVEDYGATGHCMWIFTVLTPEEINEKIFSSPVCIYSSFEMIDRASGEKRPSYNNTLYRPYIGKDLYSHPER